MNDVPAQEPGNLHNQVSDEAAPSKSISQLTIHQRRHTNKRTRMLRSLYCSSEEVTPTGSIYKPPTPFPHHIDVIKHLKRRERVISNRSFPAPHCVSAGEDQSDTLDGMPLALRQICTDAIQAIVGFMSTPADTQDLRFQFEQIIRRLENLEIEALQRTRGTREGLAGIEDTFE